MRSRGSPRMPRPGSSPASPDPCCAGTTRTPKRTRHPGTPGRRPRLAATGQGRLRRSGRPSSGAASMTAPHQKLIRLAKSGIIRIATKGKTR